MCIPLTFDYKYMYAAQVATEILCQLRLKLQYMFVVSILEEFRKRRLSIYSSTRVFAASCRVSQAEEQCRIAGYQAVHRPQATA